MGVLKIKKISFTLIFLIIGLGIFLTGCNQPSIDNNPQVYENNETEEIEVIGLEDGTFQCENNRIVEQPIDCLNNFEESVETKINYTEDETDIEEITYEDKKQKELEEAKKKIYEYIKTNFEAENVLMVKDEFDNEIKIIQKYDAQDLDCSKNKNFSIFYLHQNIPWVVKSDTSGVYYEYNLNKEIPNLANDFLQIYPSLEEAYLIGFTMVFKNTGCTKIDLNKLTFDAFLYDDESIYKIMVNSNDPMYLTKIGMESFGQGAYAYPETVFNGGITWDKDQFSPERFYEGKYDLLVNMFYDGEQFAQVRDTIELQFP
jgi:hypothetical protein